MHFYSENRSSKDEILKDRGLIGVKLLKIMDMNYDGFERGTK